LPDQGRSSIPPNLIMALGVVLVFELLYLVVLRQWLDEWTMFRLHLPALFSLAVIGVVAAVNRYEYHGFGPQEGIVRRGPNRPCVALTFDDGPSPEFTPKILDILKEQRVSAAFFMVGRHVQKYPEVARRVFREGHDIGNHTFSHRDLVPATRATIIKEITEADKIISEVIGVQTRLFRPPRGIISNGARRILVELGFTTVLWTVSAVDWRGVAPRAMVRRILRHIKPGGIVLFHDSGALLRSEGGSRGNTVEALPLVIEELRKRGYEIIPLSRLLEELAGSEAPSYIDASSVQQET
jgi:peptidoglycan-N-acetylglucosamine deacetylase